MTSSSASNVIVPVKRSMLESNQRQKHLMHQLCQIHSLGKKEWGNETYVTLCTVHWVTLIIVPSFSFPSSTRLLHIIGSNSSCLWMLYEIEIQKRIVDELSEFTWFNVETCTNGQRLKTPCTKSEISSSISVASITWWLFFHVESNRAWTKKNANDISLMSFIHLDI